MTGPAPEGELRARLHQAGAEPAIRSVPMSHVSIEVGHLYPEDWRAGPGQLHGLFADAAPWVRAAGEAVAARVPGRRARVSTCFLVDDYFGDIPGPSVVVPALLEAAGAAGVTIDYLAREAACASATGPAGPVSPAQQVVARLVDEPAPDSLGVRPPAAESGWLCNGVRAVDGAPTTAMDVPAAWAPARQHAVRRHSIVVDVQLWDDDGPRRTWSCPMLAATWQLLRLGVLRAGGQPLVEPQPPPSAWPAEWAALPPVTMLDDAADPFCAYTSVSVLAPRFLPVEVAVRTVLGQAVPDPAVLDQVGRRAEGESFPLPAELVDRIGYAFAGRSVADPS